MSTDPNAQASGVMSIREEFARTAMLGVLSSWPESQSIDDEWIINKAVQLADALISALNEEKR